MYASPYFYDGYIYFLQGNFNIDKIILYKYLPGSCCKIITAFSISAINLYNFQIIGSNLNVISQDKKLTCYYPEQFEISMKENENVVFIDDDSEKVLAIYMVHPTKESEIKPKKVFN